MSRPSLLLHCRGNGSRRRVLAVLLLLGVGPSGAMELGRPRTLSAMGEPLSVRIPITVAEGETLQPDCIGVGVEVNGHALPDSQVRRGVEPGAAAGQWQVWVKTLEPVTEPALKLTLGCPRQQVAVLVDPASSGGRAAAPVSDASTRTKAGKVDKADASSAIPKSHSSAAPSRDALLPLAAGPDAWIRVPLPGEAGQGMWVALSLGATDKAVKGGSARARTWTKGQPGARLAWSYESDPRLADAARVLAGAASRALLLQQTEVQLEHLRQQQQALNQELQQLLLASEAQQARQQWPWWLALLAGLGLAVAVGLWNRRR